MFREALFVTDKNCKQPEWSLVGGWINKMWYVHIMESTQK